MAINNYIPINRKFFGHPFWTKTREYSEAEAWLYLLKEARFEVSEGTRLIGGKVIKWNRGELPASLRFLGLEWSWSKNKVGRFLDLLVSEGMITKRTANGTDQTIITLCNYESYNGRLEKPGQQTGQARDTPGTPPGQGRDNTNKGNKGNTTEEEQKEQSASAQNFSSSSADQPLVNPSRSNHCPPWSDVLRQVTSMNGSPEQAKAFFEYNEKNDWRNSRGQPIIFWPPMVNTWLSRDAQKADKAAQKEQQAAKAGEKQLLKEGRPKTAAELLNERRQRQNH